MELHSPLLTVSPLPHEEMRTPTCVTRGCGAAAPLAAPFFVRRHFTLPAARLSCPFFSPLVFRRPSWGAPNRISPGHQRRVSGTSFDSFAFLQDGPGGAEPSEEDFVVVNFYRFVHVEDPVTEVSKHLEFLKGRDIHGRLYLNEQGINAQYSGPQEDALAYIEWIRQDHRFSDVLVQISPSPQGHAFPRLKLRYKPSLVQLEGGISHLPLVEPGKRATPLVPSEWKKRLQIMNAADEGERSKHNSETDRKILLLDVRNGYEWDVGHFQGAQRPNVDCFRTTSFGICEPELSESDPLAGIDKEQTEILMYCTGGIRCDVYSTILRQRGFQNLYTLSGGVSHFLKNEGPVGWVGNLFVFDSRLSLPPSAYKPESVPEVAEIKLLPEKSSFARCYICESRLYEFRHRNCANLDCNRLFLSCETCVEEFRGCCCQDCTSAFRLRPVLPGHQRYQKWYIYRDKELQRT